MVDGLLAVIGIGVVLPTRSSLLATGRLHALGLHLWHFYSQSEEFLDEVSVLKRT